MLHDPVGSARVTFWVTNTYKKTTNRKMQTEPR